MNDGEDVISNFMAITGSTEDDAVMYLSMHDFDLQQAVVQYQLDHPSAGDSAPSHQEMPSPIVDSGSPASPHPPMSYQMEGFGSPAEPQRPPTPPEGRILASGSNENLQRLFARPAYVVGSDSASLAVECTKAADRSCWVVVAVVDNSFPCECFTRDVWASDAMRSLTSGSIFCYEVNVTHSRGMTIAERYGVDVSHLPCMFIVDPVTKFKVEELMLVSTEAWRFDSALVVDAIMLFITSHDPPHDPFANPTASSEGREGSATGRAGGHEGAVDNPLVVDVDSEEEEVMSPPTVTPSARAQSGLTEDSFAVVAPSPVTLDEYLVDDDATDASAVFKLRCRLPHSSPTLQLRPDTPVTKLIDYLAYLLYTEDREKYTVQPQISIFSGFPPRNVTSNDMEGVSLRTWSGVRSGDVVMVRVNA
ncbi:hypothetical protein ABB37_04590 [Leptomonas pyrrhocoris]|uniref:UBX domain-containing protein n=1 Tax=Leptomonas pyrrhocoris TaxID=157538 RepID=A0A0M9G1K3_LEPPY|nr:hypothetical protein ABB37_04590 [Leptomonas pyrrhocoris]XP_015658745.1 hypothetical protein ABB37_04590 [Leptomonas pyrrhocoris]KPA80305.1 hypothetical protein ABB37_04590 [Leptomonas pyrrhocoris]KPA80306.1 hypothetical protein ABB37_04590 [Leptomonas pyrrhocoris]|eukprot:XP_015658744.1 hypothetical protein ABB37_04590 [Leptomonas pyrrhocoris]